MARVGDAIAQQRERISSLSSVIRDHRVAMGSASRRDRLLGVNSLSSPLLDGGGQSSSSGGEGGGEFKEEEVWGMMLPPTKLAEDGSGLADKDKDRSGSSTTNLFGSSSSTSAAESSSSTSSSGSKSSVLSSASLSKRQIAVDHAAVGLSSIAHGAGFSSASSVSSGGGYGGGGGRVTSASRMIPQKVADSGVAGGGGEHCRKAAMHHQSAPVNVPDWSRILGGGGGGGKNKDRLFGRDGYGDGGGGDDDDGVSVEMLPPHELVARSQSTTFSVFEGAGRTLKGRDLSRVRNAVLKQTGFL